MAIETHGVILASTLSTQLTAPGAANTKSAYTQIAASTSANCTGFYVALFGGGASGDVLFDIATGAAAAEVDIVSNAMHRANNVPNIMTYFFFPIAISAGTRISARWQTTNTSCSAYLAIYLCSETRTNPAGSGTMTAYGVDTTDSAGTGLDPGGTVNTKGAYVELTSSTSEDIDWLVIGSGLRNNSAPSNCWWFLDIATGAASSEVVVVPNLILHTHSSTARANAGSLMGPFPVTIPSGTRLSARVQCLLNDATDRLVDVAVYGINTSAVGGGGKHFGGWAG